MKNQRGWWTPMFLTARIASAKYFFPHVSRQNTLTQARRNISRHYDLSNELFALFLDETYSCAKFKMEGEDLKTAQRRKISMLIEKARVKKDHEVLEIGCGWGSLAIEIVKRTGCKYTGITLSEEQLRYAEMKVKEEGLQKKIKFLLCDYRQLQDTNKYDRIISCEMLEAVGHEYMEELFGCCESLLAEDGIFVLQFISIPDERYDEYRRSSDFIKEYIFPGGCLPSHQPWQLHPGSAKFLLWGSTKSLFVPGNIILIIAPPVSRLIHLEIIRLYSPVLAMLVLWEIRT